ncbi:MAG TPA: NAD(P)/FAD-dependent oxidoreductase [Anaerovoracaceae bacterium]|nr:NAD(P)/FAD-dependent oxidoreductase [Anaerovoracaceae bacterium]
MNRMKGPDKTITVIGGGPSGMAAAISVARQGTGTVRLIEKNDILGRKLLATGNGRCNLTNTSCPDAETVLRFFDGLGLITRVEDEGRVYPYSEQASAVREVLISELEHLKVEILCGLEVKSIEKTDSGFRITADGNIFYTDAVILATGGKAGPQYGSTGDGYRFARAFGHSVVSIRPSLVQMVSGEPFFKSLKGVRAKGQAELLHGGRTEEHGQAAYRGQAADFGSKKNSEQAADREYGEIQFTEDGLSGICIFNLSRDYVRGDIIRMDFFPEYSEERLNQILTERAKALAGRSMTEFFTGMLHKKLIPVILPLLSLEEEKKAASLSRAEIAGAVQLLKGWRIPVTGTKGWKEAQVTAGGVDLAEIDPRTMESHLAPGLYFAGELLNVDEKCGGYNLQWAWSSGLTAGKSAAAAVENKYATEGVNAVKK